LVQILQSPAYAATAISYKGVKMWRFDNTISKLWVYLGAI